MAQSETGLLMADLFAEAHALIERRCTAMTDQEYARHCFFAEQMLQAALYGTTDLDACWRAFFAALKERRHG